MWQFQSKDMTLLYTYVNKLPPTMSLSVRNEHEVSPEFIHDESREIWAKCKLAFKTKSIKLGNEAKTQTLLNEIRDQHPNFSMSYPIVVRYMVEMQEYHPDAMRKYLMRIATHPWKSDDEYLDMQAEYVVILYKETHKHWGKDKIQLLRDNVRTLLHNEHYQFKNNIEVVKSEVERQENKFKVDLKLETMRYYKSLAYKKVE